MCSERQTKTSRKNHPETSGSTLWKRKTDSGLHIKLKKWNAPYNARTTVQLRIGNCVGTSNRRRRENQKLLAHRLMNASKTATGRLSENRRGRALLGKQQRRTGKVSTGIDEQGNRRERGQDLKNKKRMATAGFPQKKKRQQQNTCNSRRA